MTLKSYNSLSWLGFQFLKPSNQRTKRRLWKNPLNGFVPTSLLQGLSTNQLYSHLPMSEMWSFQSCRPDKRKKHSKRPLTGCEINQQKLWTMILHRCLSKTQKEECHCPKSVKEKKTSTRSWIGFAKKAPVSLSCLIRMNFV